MCVRVCVTCVCVCVSHVCVYTGDEQGAVKEMERIARRAPGSVDMRAALASLYWAQGRPEDAETQ